MTGKEAKYIVLKEKSAFGGGQEYNIYPFSRHLIHKDMAVKLGGELGPSRVVGAGFIRFTDEGPKCYGESVSLKVESRPEDEVLAKIAFGEDF